MKKWSLSTLADHLLATARRAPSLRCTQTLHWAGERQLQPMMIALVGGQTLDGHDWPDGATLYVLLGRIRVAAGERTSECSAGDLLIATADLHTVESLEDAVVLLTAVTPPRRMAADPGS